MADPMEGVESMEAVKPISQVCEALKVIEDVTEISSKCLMNKHQCNRLADRVNAIGEKLKELPNPELADGKSLDAGTGEVDYPAFDVLLTTLRKGKALVSKYLEPEASIPSVLTRTENRQAFQEIHDDLDTMNSMFLFEGVESASKSTRNVMLTTDADEDLKELSESLDVVARTDQSQEAFLPTNLEKVKLVVSEKSEGTGDDLPSYLNIDPATVEVSGPVREPERSSKRDSEDTDGWTLVHFGSWLGCKCAVKVFKSGSKTWNRIELLKEAKALFQLHHPHIVQLTGFAQDEARCLILMELMDTDLGHFMKRRSQQGKRPFSRAQELEIITQIAKAMYYLHEQDYVHGELKCSNILVKQTGEHLDVKVSDLRSSQKLGVSGLVSFKERIKRSRPRFTAPEVKDYGEVRELSHELLKKIDVYAFGMVCFQVVTGKLPFQDIFDDALQRRIETGDLKQDLPGELDHRLRGLIESCWERDPNKRPTSALIFHQLDFIRSSQLAITRTSSGIATVMKHFQGIPVMLRFSGVAKARNDPPANAWGDMIVNDTRDDTEEGANAAMALPEFVRIQPNDLKKGRSLGKGSSAEVFEATWLGCKYAVKAFKRGSSIEEIQKELKLLIELRHPSVVRLMGLSVCSERRCMIVMEFMGGDLRHEIDRRMVSRKRTRKSGTVPAHAGPFDILDAVYIITKIALGMAYLHSRGVTHRDLKALNVLFPEHGSLDVKIADFGVSELIDSSESSSLVVGTSFWRAPEMFSEPRRRYDLKAADVYSFGITCYEVLTGRTPMEGLEMNSPSHGTPAVRDGARPKFRDDLIPGVLKQLVEACWDGKPERRPLFATICRQLQEIQQELRASQM